jgi:hypothetical protein
MWRDYTSHLKPFIAIADLPLRMSGSNPRGGVRVRVSPGMSGLTVVAESLALHLVKVPPFFAPDQYVFPGLLP